MRRLRRLYPGLLRAGDGDPVVEYQVGLVDVDVYASWNQNLLQRARITNIPTQIFVNGKGEGTTVIGGMRPDELSAELQALADGVDHGN